MVVDMQLLGTKKRLVVTKYSRELSWLFYQMKEASQDQIDFGSKYYFYGIMAQTAINFIGLNKNYDLSDMLFAVFCAGKDFLRRGQDMSQYLSDVEDQEDYNTPEI